jgi:hypothetical protein
VTDLPTPVQFGHLGGWITVRCPHDFDPLMRRAGGAGEPGARQSAIPASGDQAGTVEGPQRDLWGELIAGATPSH